MEESPRTAPEESPGRRVPHRPLVAAAAAALVGSWLGSWLGAGLDGGPGAGLDGGPEGGPGAGLGGAAGAGAALAALAVLLGLGALLAGPAGWRGRAALVLVAALAALRAAAGDGEPAAREGPGEGRYWPSGRFGEVERGALEGDGRRLALPAGLVRPGERLRIDPGPPPGPPARGPLVRRRAPPPIVELVADEVRRIGPPPAGLAGRARAGLARLRADATRRVEERFPEPRTAGLLAALLVGERGGLDPELSERFTRTGTRHLLAISGLHVGLVAALLVAPLGALLAGLARRVPGCPPWLRRPGPWRVALLAPLVPLSGAGAPVTRAFVAIALYSLTASLPRTRGGELRRADPLSLLALAALLETCTAPAASASASLRLSYAATLGLVLAAIPLTRALRARLPCGGRLPALTRHGRAVPALLRVPPQRLLDGLTLGVGASLAATLATLPVVWASFGELGLAGIVATPLSIPPLAALLAAGWAWLAVPCAPLEALLGVLARGLEGLLALADRLPGTPLPLPPRPAGLVLLAAGGALAVASGRAPRGVGRASAALWAAVLLPWRPAPEGLELHLLDVGHGTSAVLRAPGAPPLVFDAGSRDRRGVARGALAPLLASFETRRVVYALSHADRDHAGALPWIVERFPPALWIGALMGELEARIPRGVPRVDPDVGRVELTLAPRAREPLTVEVLRGRRTEDNEGSRSLLVSWGGQRLWLAGDADDLGLAHSLREGFLDGPLRLLLVPHHGSESRFLAPLLERAAPAEAWISASGEPPVVAELERRGIPWRSTAREGPLSLVLRPASRHRRGKPRRAGGLRSVRYAGGGDGVALPRIPPRAPLPRHLPRPLPRHRPRHRQRASRRSVPQSPQSPPSSVTPPPPRAGAPPEPLE